MLKKRKNQKGFTLIELIVVIAILGILAAVAVPRISGFTDSARVSVDKANARLLNVAVQASFSTTTPQAYPSIASALAAGERAPAVAELAALVTAVSTFLPAGTTITAHNIANWRMVFVQNVAGTSLFVQAVSYVGP